ncbi:MAG TPA: AAA family ATPase [Gemmatimonadaceae bacterium]
MTSLQLLPAQATALDNITREVDAQRVAVLMGRPGAGKTSILRKLHERLGGAFLTSRDFIEASAERDPLALDETAYVVIRSWLEKRDTVIVDDFHLVSAVSCCSHAYPRQNFLAAAMVPLADLAQELGKTLVFAAEGMAIPGLDDRVPHAAIPQFTIDDYVALAEYSLGGRAKQIDLKKVHRFAPNLSARQLRNSFDEFRADDAIDTDRFITYLRERHMASNVDLGEVQAVELHDLKGLDDVLEALEANIILPLENSDLAEELNLKPKRGVLLAGPPGTGKTTIGRALAHRLKSKFFLVDGTVISGTPHFYQHIHHIFEAAKRNAPAIIFVDDSDVIFETGQETGLYRYLLTMLDGLESASAGRVCLMMTAMDVGNLPPALVRSGRIELWLETRLPERLARRAILADLGGVLPSAFGDVDIDQLATETEGLSGADLKRVIEDGKLLFAFARARNAVAGSSTDYFLRAIATVRQNKEQYAQAEAQARVRHPVRPPYFDFVGASGGMVAMGGPFFVERSEFVENG